MNIVWPFVGIQISASSFDGDPGAVLDSIQALVPLNVAMVFHQDRLRRTAASSGGTMFKHPQKLDASGSGILERLREPAEKRNVKVILGIGEDRWGYYEGYPGYTTIGMVDYRGRVHRQSCVNNPTWRNFQVASIEDIVLQNPSLYGMMFMHERIGPLSAAFFDAGYGDGRVGYCFCEHCCRLGKERGLDPQRAREGYRKLDQVVNAALANEPRPADGWFITIWRLFQRYHEILGWDQLWWDCLHDFRAACVGAAKTVRREFVMGYHFQHAAHMNHFLWRAGDDPARIVEYADFVKPSVYPGCSGVRSRNNVNRLNEVLFKDMPKSVVNEFSSWIMGHDPKTLPDPVNTEGEVGFGADWVKRETARVVAACKPRPVFAGLGIGVPTGTAVETPQYISECAHACYDGGAAGILLSRHYHEIKPELLAAAGSVIRQRISR